MSEVGGQFISHWDHQPWRPGERRLHWYVLPSDAARRKAAEVQGVLARPELDAVPGLWLHCTILALAGSGLSTPGSQLALFEAGRDAVSSLHPFGASGKTRVTTQGVTWDLAPFEPFVELQERLLTVSTAFLRRTPEPPIRPHISLFYSNAEKPWSDTVALATNAALAAAPFEIDEVLLLDVARDPGGACYHWDVIGAAPLGG